MEYKYKLGFLGAGNMAKAIARGIVKSSILLKDTNFEILLKLSTLYINKLNDGYKVAYLLEDQKKIEYEIKYKFI